MKLSTKLIITLLVVGAFIALYTLTPLKDYFNLILEQKDNIVLQVQDAFLLSAVIYVVVYILVVAFSMPVATVLTLAGGFFFGPFVAVVLINIGATAGAFLLFLTARYFLGKDIQSKYKDKLEIINREVLENGVSYFLTLRLIPIFPFFLINLLAGFTNIKARTFLWTTALGIIPGSFVYAFIGDTGSNAGPTGAFGIQITIALVLLGLLSLMPTVIKKVQFSRKNKASGESELPGEA